MDANINKEKLDVISNNIRTLEDAIYNIIDDTIMEKELEMTLTEVVQALINATRKINNKGLLEIIKK